MNRMSKYCMLFLLAVGFVSCEEDRVSLSDNATEAYAFEKSIGEFAVTETQQTYSIDFGSTNKEGSDRVIPIVIDATSTLPAGSYTAPSSVVIPAGQRVGQYNFNVDFNALTEGVEYKLVITIDPAAYPILDDRGYHVVTVFKYCGTESLAGEHTFVQTNLIKGGPGGGPVPGTITGTMTWAETSTGVFSFADLTWGHYEEVWADSPAADGAGVKWTCNGLVAVGTDQYDDTFTYNIVSVNGPVLTFTWTNTYGDGGTVEVTREGNLPWPDGLMAN